MILTATQFAAADDHELLNQEERQWLDSLQEPLIFATEVGYHPYNFVDENGELSGVVGDYVRRLQDDLGFEYEVRAFDTFSDVLDAARQRQVDVVPLIVAAPERKSYLNFTQPVYETSDRIFVRQETQEMLSLDTMAGMRVGTVQGYALVARIEKDFPEIDLVLVPTELAGLLDVSLGEIDAFISEVGTSSYYIQQEAITNLRIAGEIEGTDAQSFGSRKDWPILNSILGKGLAHITDEEHDAIQRRWISIAGTDGEHFHLDWGKVGTATGLVLLLLIALLIWTLSMRRLVAKRTLELQQELEERHLVEADNLRLAVAVEQSAEFILIVDTSANIEYANASFLHACGVADLEGQSFESLAVGVTKDSLAKTLGHVHRTGTWRGDVVLATKSDDELKVRMTIAPIFSTDSDIDGYVVTARDVSKEKKLEQQLRQGEKLSALGTLAGGIAHDFNNLLVPILGYADLIRSHPTGDIGPYLDGMTEASERARDLVKRIMVFGRGGSGEMVPVDLAVEIEDAISFLKNLLPTSVDIQKELHACGAILGDRTQIQQILLNLCSNASDAMTENGGTLTIKLEPSTNREMNRTDFPNLGPGDYALLSVSDTGVGMTEETRSKIFDPYFTEKLYGSGTGLGLAIVHGVVTRHGGAIHVRSEPGQGSTFQICLPIVPEEAPESDDKQDTKTPRGNGETILLVDDDELVLGTIKMMIEGLGYNVSAWSDPIAALSALGAQPDAFDAILTDFTMPGLNGVQLLEKATTVRADIPFALMTGNVGAIANYDDECLSKPMTLTDLATRLHKMLHN
ncbi:MAG: ATP-binding protein [Woeseiaceae bacterium]